MPLDTEHLRLVPAAAAHILALIERPEAFASLAGMPAAAGLHELYNTGEVSRDWLAALRAASSADPWRYGFWIVHGEEGCVIGSAGFKGPPDAEGVVEIAYGMAPGYEGRGFATEAAGALVTYASANPDVQMIRAHTLPEANASTHVLRKCGFSYLGEVEDPEDGLVWRWERPPQPATRAAR